MYCPYFASLPLIRYKFNIAACIPGSNGISTCPPPYACDFMQQQCCKFLFIIFILHYDLLISIVQLKSLFVTNLVLENHNHNHRFFDVIKLYPFTTMWKLILFQAKLSTPEESACAKTFRPTAGNGPPEVSVATHSTAVCRFKACAHSAAGCASRLCTHTNITISCWLAFHRITQIIAQVL